MFLALFYTRLGQGVIEWVTMSYIVGIAGLVSGKDKQHG